MRISDWSSDVCSSDLSNMVARSIMWSWDTYIQDEWDNVVLDQGVFKRRAVEAVKYMVDLYHKTMTPAVFAWNAASNNQDLLAGKASERKSVVSGKSVSGRVARGGRRFIKQKNN